MPGRWGKTQARPYLQAAIEAGINFFDTANVYSDGTSEEDPRPRAEGLAPRDEIVIATKVHGAMRPRDRTGAACRARPS